MYVSVSLRIKRAAVGHTRTYIYVYIQRPLTQSPSLYIFSGNASKLSKDPVFPFSSKKTLPLLSISPSLHMLIQSVYVFLSFYFLFYVIFSLLVNFPFPFPFLQSFIYAYLLFRVLICLIFIDLYRHFILIA